MKVILNDDVKHLGEMGDVKNVANGYARNYLFPRMLAVPYNADTVAYFEGKKAEIEARKEKKREESKSLKEKLEALSIELVMPAGSNGKLFGAVTSQTLSDYFKNNGFEIERKRIEVPGLTIKNVGAYSFKVHLYEAAIAEVKLAVKAQPTEDNSKSSAKKDSKKQEKPAKEDDSAKAEDEASAEKND